MYCYEVKHEFDVYSTEGVHTFIEGELVTVNEVQRVSKRHKVSMDRLLRHMNDLGKMKPGHTFMFFGVRHLTRRGKRKLGRED